MTRLYAAIWRRIHVRFRFCVAFTQFSSECCVVHIAGGLGLVTASYREPLEEAGKVP
jgi:hypothetical protein